MKFPPEEQASDAARGLGVENVASVTEELTVLFRFAQSVTCCNSSTNGLRLEKACNGSSLYGGRES